jgi:hypothetical protein
MKVGAPPPLTFTTIEVVVAHCPELGVKVYVPEVVLLTVAGFHVPEMPFNEVAGKTGAGSPWQIAGIGLKDGVTAGFTVI